MTVLFSVDADTDSLMQRVLRSEFAGCTILAVSHKLDAVLDFDKVVLLDSGRIVEVGNPRQLLSTPSSRFGAQYGKSFPA
jgi:ATP-binding cassette subfamily C (CFTR/MRP) protein 1